MNSPEKKSKPGFKEPIPSATSERTKNIRDCLDDAARDLAMHMQGVGKTNLEELKTERKDLVPLQGKDFKALAVKHLSLALEEATDLQKFVREELEGFRPPQKGANTLQAQEGPEMFREIRALVAGMQANPFTDLEEKEQQYRDVSKLVSFLKQMQLRLKL